MFGTAFPDTFQYDLSPIPTESKPASSITCPLPFAFVSTVSNFVWNPSIDHVANFNPESPAPLDANKAAAPAASPDAASSFAFCFANAFDTSIRPLFPPNPSSILSGALKS